MKRLFLFACILLNVNARAQYQVQKGHWFISHTIGGYAMAKYDYKRYQKGILISQSTWKDNGVTFGFSGPYWGNLEAITEKSREDNSNDESKSSVIEISLQPQAGYFVRDNLMIGASLLIGLENKHYRDKSSSVKENTWSLGIGPMARYYFGKGAKGRPFVGFESSFNHLSYKSNSEYVDGMSKTQGKSKDTASNYLIQPYAGYGWFWGKRWTASLRIDYLYSREKSRTTQWYYNGGVLANGYPRSENYETTTKTFAINIGIGYTL